MSIDATPAPIGADALSVAAQVALAEYANPLNWEADENGIRRIWREPDSCTPDAYDGFKLARAALASAAQPQAATDYSACASADSNYAAGMLIGWNLCVAGDEASFGRIREDRMRAAIQASRAAWVYGQPMAPCPKCGSYNMKPQMPIKIELAGDETTPHLLGKWARATKEGATPLQGPAYYCCWDCGHKGPAVDCTGRTSEECRADRALNAEMKRLWNTQTPNVQIEGAARLLAQLPSNAGLGDDDAK